MSAAKKYPSQSHQEALAKPSDQAISEADAEYSKDGDGVIKRISPYPFSVDLLKVEGQPALKGQIVKLTDVGFLMKVDTLNFYRISEKYQLSFILPVMEVPVRSQGKVVKTYDGLEQFKKESSKKQYLVEIHFIELPSNAKTSINNYLAKSGQKKF